MPEWDVYAGLNTKLAAPAQDFALPPNYNRKTTRSMGKVAIMSVRATEVALREAGLHDIRCCAAAVPAWLWFRRQATMSHR